MNDLKSLQQRSVSFRGHLIEGCANLENYLDVFISTYFTQNERLRSELINLIFKTTRITFESKRQVFDYLIKTHFPKTLSKYPAFNKDLIYIIEQRNIVAHYQLDISEDSILIQEKRLVYLKYKNELSEEIFTDTKILELYKKIWTCADIIKEFVGEITIAPSGPDIVHNSEPS